MANTKNHSQLLGQLAGEGGDIYIGAQAVSNVKLTHVIFGPDGGTLVGVQIGNQSVMSERMYPSAMPGGYVMCAGLSKFFNHIELSAGNASGLLLDESEFKTL